MVFADYTCIPNTSVRCIFPLFTLRARVHVCGRGGGGHVVTQAFNNDSPKISGSDKYSVRYYTVYTCTGMDYHMGQFPRKCHPFITL